MDTRRRAVLAGLLLTAVRASQTDSITQAQAADATTAPAAGTLAGAIPAAAPNPAIAAATVPATVPAAPVQQASSTVPNAAAPNAPAPTVPAPTVPAQAIAAAPPASGDEPYRKYAVTPPPQDGRPIICIVVDDLGVMRKGTDRIVALPGPMTLSWFPFAPNVERQVREGMERGHEATLHMPMQSFSNSTRQTGPDPLRIDLPPEVNLARLRTAMDAVPYTVGLNNHMGSVATKDAALMALVAKETKSRGMLFLDSLTIGGSQGWRQAAAAGVFSDARDEFIDDSPRPDMIQKALATIEEHARRHGNVIAIGHPRPHTVEAMEAWVPTLASKGFVMWPLSATMALRAQENVRTAHFEVAA